jgi:hypothetical protein
MSLLGDFTTGIKKIISKIQISEHVLLGGLNARTHQENPVTLLLIDFEVIICYARRFQQHAALNL